jgi:hypothetical protein
MRSEKLVLEERGEQDLSSYFFSLLFLCETCALHDGGIRLMFCACEGGENLETEQRIWFLTKEFETKLRMRLKRGNKKRFTRDMDLGIYYKGRQDI